MTPSSLDVYKAFQAQRRFAKARAWDQFHTPKNLATALLVEASELAELFQWLTPAQSRRIMAAPETAQAVKDEIGDVLSYVLRLCDKLAVDPGECFWQKLAKTEKKYPVALSKGTAAKYNQLHARRRARAQG